MDISVFLVLNLNATRKQIIKEFLFGSPTISKVDLTRKQKLKVQTNRPSFRVDDHPLVEHTTNVV